MRHILCGAAVILSGLYGTAHSATLLGTVNSGLNSTDTGGLFGPTGASLAGDAITVSFDYANFSPMTGTGLFFGQGTGALSIGATINGVPISISNGDPVATSTIFIGPMTTNFVTGQGSAGANSATLNLATTSTSTITSIIALTGPASSGDTISLVFPRGRFPGDTPRSDTLSFTLTPPTTVPEPGTIALLITGLLGLGFGVCRRNFGAGFTPAG